MKFLLDTNVLSEVGAPGADANVKKWLASVNDIDLALSALSIKEWAKGIETVRRATTGDATKRAQRQQLAQDLTTRVLRLRVDFSGRILAITPEVAEVWGTMLGVSDKHQEDAGFAATAFERRLVLVTRNLRDFKGRGVPLLDPFKDPPTFIP